MIILLACIAFYLGLLSGKSTLIILVSLLSLSLIIFVSIRFGIKKGAVVLATLLSGVLISHIPIEYKVKKEYRGVVINVKENYFIFKSSIYKYYVREKDNNYEIGDVLTIKGKIEDFSFKHYESQFNFKQYLNDKGIKKQLVPFSVKYNFKNPLRLSRRKRDFLSNFDNDTRVLIDALLFNNKDYNNEIISKASSINLIHLLAMNGVYLYFFLKVLNYIFSLFLDEKKSRILSFIFLGPYLLCSITKIGVLRIIFMRLLSFINEYGFKKRFSYLTLLGVCGFTFLFLNPFNAFQSGFYIGFFVSIMMSFVRGSLTRFKKRTRSILSPFLIYIMIFPMVGIGGGEVHLFSLIFQSIMLPFNEIYALLCVISFYSVPFKGLLRVFSTFLSFLINIYAKIDIGIPFMKVSQIFIILYYIGLLHGLFLFESKRKKHLRINALFMVLLIMIPMIPIKPLLTNAIYFINVGQGDSILIHNKNINVLVDTGGNLYFDMAEETLIPFFHKIGVRKLDLLITTHNDMDHCYAKDSLMENFYVKEYRHKKGQFPYQIGDLYFDNLNTYFGEDENDKSLVFNLSFMNKKWLLTGDASINIERFLIDDKINEIDCDILKVGHHGSKFSTCEEFLKITSPEIAIISCGVNNNYGHPNKRVMDLLKKYNVQIRRTDYEGTISFVQFA